MEWLTPLRAKEYSGKLSECYRVEEVANCAELEESIVHTMDKNRQSIDRNDINDVLIDLALGDKNE
jgi:hypothetical protein